MKAKQGWIPFSRQLKNHEIDHNVNYHRFTQKLFFAPWLSDVTGYYNQLEFDFSDMTLDTLSQDLVIRSVLKAQAYRQEIQNEETKENVVLEKEKSQS
jgi:hypothetical protein